MESGANDENQLDLCLSRVMDGLFRTRNVPAHPFRKFDRDLPTIAAAPPSLAHFALPAASRDREFAVDGDQRHRSRGYMRRARAVAGGLVTAYGLERRPGGDRGAQFGNWVPMAVLMAGGVATLLNGWWTGEELAHGIDLVRVQAGSGRPPAGRAAGRAGHGAQVLPLVHDCCPRSALRRWSRAGRRADAAARADR
jgi:hypothetical protein